MQVIKRLPIILCSLIFALLLQACLPAVFIAGAATGGVIIYDKRNPKVMVEDRDIVAKAQNIIDSDRELHAQTHVSVVAFNHIVLLVGQASNEQLRDKIINIVKELPKIKLIHNEITIENPISKSARTHDTWITAKVRTVLLAQKGLSTTQIKIVTENGIVYLLGMITREKADVVTSEIRQVAGIKKIVKLFEYIK
jgi:osmotically-inducible protein OsmY